MLLIDVDKVLPPPATDADKARVVAQWAVNVVDFRDRDSIMTPFEYDPEPFNAQGWRPDGDPATTVDNGLASHVVWGCERPELLITETLALHDRRVENLDPPNGLYRPLDATEKTQAQPPPGWDPTFDQRKMPMASLFLEFYNPWTSLEPQAAEMSNAPNGGVDLSRFVIDGNIRWPVWRMVIVAPTNPAPDPDPVDGGRTPNVERSVYFLDWDRTNIGSLPQADQPDAAGVERFYWKPASGEQGIGVIPPRTYAVIGPRGASDTDPNTFTTYIGRRTGSVPDLDPSDTDQTRQIRLKSRSGTSWVDTTGFPDSPVRNNGTLAQPSRGQILQPVTIGIGSPRRLNISDPPYTGYPPCEDQTKQVYDPIKDTPLDYVRTDRLKDAVRLCGTTEGVAKVHLQRLADPTRGYNRYTNPYRTIDSMSIDLTAFNGWGTSRTSRSD